MLSIDFSQFSRRCATVALMAISGWAQADWSLQNQQSQLNFVSVKKSAVVETHQFKQLAGSIDAQGNARVEIDLTSVSTGIAIRDQRMQNMLFETEQYPSATLSAKIDTQWLNSLQSGESKALDLTFTLSLHGASQSINTAVQVTALNNDELLINTLQPVVVKAADFDLLAGIDKLKTVAGLPSITLAIPVTAQLRFKQQ